MGSVDILPAPQGTLGQLIQDYAHPREVLADDRLTDQQKRAILCFWASYACSLYSRPGFRWLQGTPGPILFDHVIAALRNLDVADAIKAGPYASRAPQPLQATA